MLKFLHKFFNKNTILFIVGKCAIIFILLFISIFSIQDLISFNGKVTPFDEYISSYKKAKSLYPWITPSLFLIIKHKSKKLNIPNSEFFVLSVIKYESGGYSKSLGIPVGKYNLRAVGLMQVMPFHLPKGVDYRVLYDPILNVSLGIDILAKYYFISNENLIDTLKNYNSGPNSSYYNIAYISKVISTYYTEVISNFNKSFKFDNYYDDMIIGDT